MAEKTIFARAIPSRVKISESYFFKKTLSRNPYTGPDLAQPPVGKIEIIMPYDGDQYFTRQAYRDIKKQLNTKAPLDSQEARFGHLAFMNYDGTDLRDILDLNEHYGSFPLSVPILGHGITSIEELYTDTLTSRIGFDYAPKWPETPPVDLVLNLWDEETLDWPDAEKSDENKQLALVAKEITQQINFRPNLLIRSSPFIHLPRYIVQEDVKPRLKQISLKWPTLTSFRGLHLSIGPSSTEENRVMYNPQTRSLEWGDIPMMMDTKLSNVDMKVFRTDWMELYTDYPGELYEQSCIEGEAVIEIPGLLLSGTQVRLFDAMGERMMKTQPQVVSRLHISFELILDEAFAKRTLSPYQHLYFDEIIPDEMRIDDIKTAIADRGFKITQDQLLATHPDIRYVIKADRSEGPDKMKLSVFIEGTRLGAERETQVKGGQKFRSSTESGDLKVYMTGEMQGNSKRLTQEMNALHASLHERFERLRSRR